jgi:predicted kinase
MRCRETSEVVIVIVVMAGLPGTGKSAIARRLAQLLPAIILDKDRVRAALFPPSEIEYSLRQDDFCMDLMVRVAAYVLRRDPTKLVIVDGRTFSRRHQLALWLEHAADLGVPVKIVECVCPDETVRERLEHDAAAGTHPATNRDYAMYLSVKARFEPIEYPKLIVDTNDDLECCVQRVLRYVRADA